jgi:hypothetical protein
MIVIDRVRGKCTHDPSGGRERKDLPLTLTTHYRSLDAKPLRDKVGVSTKAT